MIQEKKEVLWRVIPLQDYDIHALHALEDALLYTVERGMSPPTIIFARVSEPSISIACHQNINDVNRELCSCLGIPLARRKTGGRGMFLTPEHLIVNVIGKPEHMDVRFRDIPCLYAWLYAKITQALQEILGVLTTTDQNHSNIIVNNQKIGGLSQLQTQGVMLVHGYVRYAKARPLETQCIRFNNHELITYFEYFSDSATSVQEHQQSLGFFDFYDKFATHVLKELKYTYGSLNESDQNEARKRQEQHRREEWIIGTPDLPSKGHCDQTSIKFSLEP